MLHQDQMGHSLVLDLARESHHAIHGSSPLQRKVQPAEPAVFIGAAPDERIGGPHAPHGVLLTQHRKAFLNLRIQIGRQEGGEIGHARACTGRRATRAFCRVVTSRNPRSMATSVP